MAPQSTGLLPSACPCRSCFATATALLTNLHDSFTGTPRLLHLDCYLATYIAVLTNLLVEACWQYSICGSRDCEAAL